MNVFFTNRKISISTLRNATEQSLLPALEKERLRDVKNHRDAKRLLHRVTIDAINTPLRATTDQEMSGADRETATRNVAGPRIENAHEAVIQNDVRDPEAAIQNDVPDPKAATQSDVPGPKAVTESDVRDRAIVTLNASTEIKILTKN
jgi:hypothetical protein